MTLPQTASTPRVATVIVNYGAADLILRGVEPLIAQTRAMPGSRIVIVDNASPGDDASKLAAFAASETAGGVIDFIPSARNGGFSSGNNVAFRSIMRWPTPPDYVFLLNPDAYLRNAALEELVRLLEAHPRAGVAGAALEGPDGDSQSSAFFFPDMMREFAAGAGIGLLLRRWSIPFPQKETPQQVGWVSGAAMMFRAGLLDEVGLMDEGYFLYFDETDFIRMIADRGWEVWRAPGARVAHEAGATTGLSNGAPRAGRMPSYWFDSWMRYYTKHHGVIYARACAGAHLAGLLICAAHRRLRGKPLNMPEGYISDFARRCLFGPAPARVVRRTIENAAAEG